MRNLSYYSKVVAGKELALPFIPDMVMVLVTDKIILYQILMNINILKLVSKVQCYLDLPFLELIKNYNFFLKTFIHTG